MLAARRPRHKAKPRSDHHPEKNDLRNEIEKQSDRVRKAALTNGFRLFRARP